MNLQLIVDGQVKTFDVLPKPPPMIPEERKSAQREHSRAGRMMNKTTFRFIKNLGQGGMGLVTLWEYRQPGRRQVRRLVLKISIQSMPGNKPKDARVAVTDTIKREKAFITVGFCVPVNRCICPEWCNKDADLLAFR